MNESCHFSEGFQRIVDMKEVKLLNVNWQGEGYCQSLSHTFTDVPAAQPSYGPGDACSPSQV